MSNGTFTHHTITLKPVTQDAIQCVQNILDHAPYYHANVVKYSAQGLALRCFQTQPPALPDSRVFKRFFLIYDARHAVEPVAALDLFVGFPNYKTASIAMLVIREDMQRKLIGTELLSDVLPAYLNDQHPAVQTLSVSLTENNVPALRCLLKCHYERTNRWEKLDIQGQPVIAVTFKKTFK